MRHDRIDPNVDSGHPWSGRMGDRMSRPVETIRHDTPVPEAWALMQRRGIRHLPVVDARCRLVGIVTDQDLRRLAVGPRRRAGRTGPARREPKVESVMTPSVVTVRLDTPVHEAVRLMHESRTRVVVVLDAGDQLAGIFTERDALAALAETANPLTVRRAPGRTHTPGRQSA